MDNSDTPTAAFERLSKEPSVIFVGLALQSVALGMFAIYWDQISWVMKSATSAFAAWFLLIIFDVAALFIAFEFGKNRKIVVFPMLIVWAINPILCSFALHATVFTYVSSGGTRIFFDVMSSEGYFYLWLTWLCVSLMVTYRCSLFQKNPAAK
jgi:hypothetical protein